MAEKAVCTVAAAICWMDVHEGAGTWCAALAATFAAVVAILIAMSGWLINRGRQRDIVKNALALCITYIDRVRAEAALPKNSDLGVERLAVDAAFSSAGVMLKAAVEHAPYDRRLFEVTGMVYLVVTGIQAAVDGIEEVNGFVPYVSIRHQFGRAAPAWEQILDRLRLHGIKPLKSAV